MRRRRPVPAQLGRRGRQSRPQPAEASRSAGSAEGSRSRPTPVEVCARLCRTQPSSAGACARASRHRAATSEGCAGVGRRLQMSAELGRSVPRARPNSAEPGRRRPKHTPGVDVAGRSLPSHAPGSAGSGRSRSKPAGARAVRSAPVEVCRDMRRVRSSLTDASRCARRSRPEPADVGRPRPRAPARSQVAGCLVHHQRGPALGPSFPHGRAAAESGTRFGRCRLPSAEFVKDLLSPVHGSADFNRIPSVSAGSGTWLGRALPTRPMSRNTDARFDSNRFQLLAGRSGACVCGLQQAPSDSGARLQSSVEFGRVQPSPMHASALACRFRWGLLRASTDPD